MVDQAEVPQAKPEGFKPITWLAEIERQVATLASNQRLEFTLPEETHPYYFMSELGRGRRGYEIGGVYNPKTRSVLMARGGVSYADDSYGRDFVALPTPRINADGSSDDMLFHTHVNKSGVPPAAACLPSTGGSEGDDLSMVYNYSLAEKWDGHPRNLVSVIAYGGHISVTESQGVHLDEPKLLAAGITEKQLVAVKRMLGLYPSFALENTAKAQTNGAALLKRLVDFYDYCDSDRSTGYIEKYQAFEEELRRTADDYGLSAKHLDYLVDQLKTQEGERRYASVTFMVNQGMTREQAELFQSMFGIKTSVYRVDENGMVAADPFARTAAVKILRRETNHP